MIYANTSLDKNISKLLPDYQKMRIGRKEDEEDIHRILESVKMELGKDIQLTFSRRPNLFASFEESHQSPLVIIDHDKSFLGVISENETLFKGKREKSFYTSDLRVTPKATPKTRLEFRDLYSQIVEQLDAPCFTSVLNENKRAIKALTSKKFPLSYNKVFEYMSRTFLILPGFSFNTLKLEEVSYEDFSFFLKEKFNKSEFSHPIFDNHRYFILKERNKGEVVCGFSLKKSKYKSLVVDSQSRWIQLLVKSTGLFKKRVKSNQLECIYLGHLFVEDKYRGRDDLFKLIVNTLKKEKILDVFDIFIMAHSLDDSRPYTQLATNQLSLAGVQFTQKAWIYQVEKEEVEREIKGDIFIDPSQL